MTDKPMTLEKLRDTLTDALTHPAILAGFDAAIRERDELRAAHVESERQHAKLCDEVASEMTRAEKAEAALTALRAADTFGLDQALVEYKQRAEKAESELAALRKRIGRFGASLPVGWWGGRLYAEWDADKESIFTREVEGKRVRLLVEDDDV